MEEALSYQHTTVNYYQYLGKKKGIPANTQSPAKMGDHCFKLYIYSGIPSI